MRLQLFPFGFGKKKFQNRIREEYPHLTPYPFAVERLTLIDGTQVAVTDQGWGQDTLFFVHGLASSMLVWKKNLPTLRKRFRCVAIDLPGYGYSSPAPRPLEMTYLASVVNEVIHRKRLSNVTLVGHSMGGQVCMTAALRYPRTVRGLILAAPAGLERFSRLQKSALRQSFHPSALKRSRPDQIRKHAKLSFYRFEEEADFMIQDRVRLIGTPALDTYCETVSQSVNAMVAGEVWEQLPLIQQPTLIVFGENDPLIPNRLFQPLGQPRWIAEAGARRIPHAQLVMLTRCGHFVPFEKPQAFQQALMNFLEK